jgi:hypothetical protein
VLSTTMPVRPAVPASALRSTKLPLVVSTATPEEIVTFPPVAEVAVSTDPPLITTSAPLPLLPEPGAKYSAPLRPPFAVPLPM